MCPIQEVTQLREMTQRRFGFGGAGVDAGFDAGPCSYSARRASTALTLAARAAGTAEAMAAAARMSAAEEMKVKTPGRWTSPKYAPIPRAKA